MGGIYLSTGTQYKMGKGTKSWLDGRAQTLTFVVTEDCNLRCKYCYMVHKNDRKRMSLETGKKAVDFFLSHDGFTEDAVIIDFIGGEPFLEIELIDQIADYFVSQAYKRKHRWFDCYRFNFSTNGLLYSDPRVQEFIRKHEGKVSVGVTIDGTKEKHDLQRVYADGSGSYEDVLEQVLIWQKQFPGATTKVTLGHDDLPLLAASVKHLWSLGMKDVPANVVFEDVWAEGDDLVLEQQLRDLADYVIDNQKWNEVSCSFFTDVGGFPLSDEELNRNYCGSGRMVAVDGNGNLYPCVRYMDFSLEHKKGYTVGTLDTGFDSDRIRPFLALDVPSQSDPECLECEIATSCAWCQGYNYDSASEPTNYQRSKGICKMHKARIRANNYYWGRLFNEHQILREAGREHKQHLFVMASDQCVNHCNYSPQDLPSESIGDDALQAAAKFAAEHFMTPVLLHDDNPLNSERLRRAFATRETINIVPLSQQERVRLPGTIVVVTPDQVSASTEIMGDNCVLSIEATDIADLGRCVEILLDKVTRTNINIIDSSKSLDVSRYVQELGKINVYLSEYYSRGQVREVDKVTDRLVLSKMNNCEAGYRNFAFGPNGKIYACPAFYFADPSDSIGSPEGGLRPNLTAYRLDRAPICSHCDAFHCNRCVYLNRRYTSEINTPSSQQCSVAHAERENSRNFYLLLQQQGSLSAGMQCPEAIGYTDPLDVLVKAKQIAPSLPEC